MKYLREGERIATLSDALLVYTKAEILGRLAALTGARDLPTRKGELAAIVVRHLAGDRLLAVWRALDETQRAAVAEVAHSIETVFPAERFRAKYGQDPNWGTGEPHDYRRFKPSALGFFFYRGVMPDDLKARLAAVVPPPAAAAVQTIEQPPETHAHSYYDWDPAKRVSKKVVENVPVVFHERELGAQRELSAVLRLIDSGRVAVSLATRRPSAAAQAAVGKVLEGGDFYPEQAADDGWEDDGPGPIRAFAWPLLVQAGRLAEISGSRLRLTRGGREALAAPAAAAIKSLWQKWLGATFLDELARIESVKGQTGRGKRGLTAVGWRRGVIAGVLAECSPGAWIRTDEFLRFLRASEHGFKVTRSPWFLYVGELQYGALGYDEGERMLNERYVLAFLLEMAATLGVIDVGLVPPAGARPDFLGLWGTEELPFFSRYDGLLCLRVTALGSYCLGGTEYRAAPAKAGPRLRVLPNLEVAAIGSGLGTDDRLALDAYAVQASEFVWRLDAARLLAAVEAGRPVDEIRAFLTDRSGAALPAPVAHLLEDVARRSAAVQDQGLARLVECADPALAALIANDRRTSKYCLPAGERHLVVFPQFDVAFQRGLRALGYFVASGDAGRPAGRTARGSSKPRRKKG